MPDAVVRFATLAGPWGPIQAAATDRGVIAIALLTTPDAFRADVARLSQIRPSDAAGDAGAPAGADWADGEADDQPADQHLGRLAAEFDAWVRGALPMFSVPLDLRVGSAWDRRVLAGVREIGRGSVATYGEVAARIGRFGAARAVGGAVGRNPIAIVIPCHRVVAAGGAIGGYGGDWHGTREERLALKRELLRREGVTLRDDPMALAGRFPTHGSLGARLA